MIIRSLFFFFLVSFLTVGYGQQPNADTIMKEAIKIAAGENKKVFIIFHASWCIWCRKMDSSMNDKSCKNFFDDNYIVRHLTVLESKDKKHLENPVAAEMLGKYKGVDQGIPFWLIFDKYGNLLADSQLRPDGAALDKQGTNTGCPASEEEVNYFISVLKKTSRMSAPQLDIIKKRFRENEN